MNRIKIFGVLAFLFFAVNIVFGGFQGFKWGTGTTSGEIYKKHKVNTDAYSYRYNQLGCSTVQWLQADLKYRGIKVKVNYGFAWKYFAKGLLSYVAVEKPIKLNVYRSLVRKYGRPLRYRNLRIIDPEQFWTFNIAVDVKRYKTSEYVNNNRYKTVWKLPKAVTKNDYDSNKGSYVTPSLYYIWRTKDDIILAEKSQFTDRKDKVDIYYLDRRFEKYADKLIRAVRGKIAAINRINQMRRSARFDSML